MDKQTLEHLPFFKGYTGSDVIIDPELFIQWVEREHDDELLTVEESERAEEAWREYRAGEGTSLSAAKKVLLQDRHD